LQKERVWEGERCDWRRGNASENAPEWVS